MQYVREAALYYADRYWNRRNPDFPDFEVNCTNYVSQCLLAGGIPMQFADTAELGWWLTADRNAPYGFRWSYSWALAHSLRWYLAAAPFATLLADAAELSLGDVISYDFNGNNAWQHTAIVTAFDRSGSPLVNANSSDSYHRFWTYADSPAYTQNIQYRFFHIE